MSKLTICKGLPGSGKSTWAKAEVERDLTKTFRVNKDEIRLAVGQPWSRELEGKVINIRDGLIKDALKNFEVVISDDTNLAPKHEKRLRELAKEAGAEVELKSFLDVPIEECIRRDSLRVGAARVGEKVIRDMAAQFLAKPKVEMVKYVEDRSLPLAIICDLDGTLALHQDRGPFDYHKVDTDKVNSPVYEILSAMSVCGRHIVYLSGREDVAREKTESWLKTNGCPNGPLFMRAAKDFRKDSIVKYELFDQHIRPYYRVEFVLDDRDQVVKMWRDLGLTCLQVNYGNF